MPSVQVTEFVPQNRQRLIVGQCFRQFIEQHHLTAGHGEGIGTDIGRAAEIQMRVRRIRRQFRVKRDQSIKASLQFFLTNEGQLARMQHFPIHLAQGCVRELPHGLQGNARRGDFGAPGQAPLVRRRQNQNHAD